MVTPLNIAVIGCGRIGSAFAFQLARVGQHSVTVIARPNSLRLRQLQRDDGIINNKSERAQVQFAARLDTTIAYDLVIVTTLAHQVDAVLPALQRSAAKWIQFMFNTFEPGRLRDAVSAERCSFGMPFVQSQIDQDGWLKATIGAMGQKCLMGDQRWVDVFNGAALPTVLEPNMLLWLRAHAPLCVAFESVSVAAMKRGGGASWSHAITLARGAKECWSLIQAQGDQIYPKGKARLNGSPAWVLGLILWFISRIKSFRELLATGIEEARALVDAMVSAAVAKNSTISAAKIQAMKP